MADNSDTESQSSQAVADVTVLIDYLRKIVPLLLEDGEPSAALDNALAHRVHQEYMKKFLSDVQSPSLLIARSVTKGNHKNMTKIKSLNNVNNFFFKLIKFIKYSAKKYI